MTTHNQRRRAAFIHPNALAVCRIQSGDTSITATHHHRAVRNLRHAQHFAGYQAFPFQFAVFIVCQHITFVASDKYHSIATGDAATHDYACIDAPHLLAGGAIQTHQTAFA
jgi:hypothetical protein